MMESAAKPTPDPRLPTAPPCMVVIFGAHGDLTKRLLIPALYNLRCGGLVDDGLHVLGVDHAPQNAAGFRKALGDFMRGLAADPSGEFGARALDAEAWRALGRRLDYLQGDFTDPQTYVDVAAKLNAAGGASPLAALFYLAVSPRFFGEVIDRLVASDLMRETRGVFRRVVVEKPFGHDLASAQALDRRILASLDEAQVYRIDHFLGKETVRNILAFRFANTVFESVWNREAISSVQITAAETVGVEGRGAYYDRTGAMRDMAPSHLLQLLGMVAMEEPRSFDAAAIHAARARVITAIARRTSAQARTLSVRGQYGAGQAGGRSMPAYRDADAVAPDSRTETYVALKLAIDNPRWAGVPFYLRTGKAMSARDTEIAIRFKRASGGLFRGAFVAPPGANELVLQIQPDEGVSLAFEAKRPGPHDRLAPVRMDFRYADYFKARPSTGYETLLYDALVGDQTLFRRADEIAAGWRAVQPFLDAWSDGGEVYDYAAGQDGPAEAARWIARDGRCWRPVGAARSSGRVADGLAAGGGEQAGDLGAA